MEHDRLKWNSRYAAEGFFLGPNPSRYLVERIGLVEALVSGRKALDIACGEGRNSIFLARRGFSVTGVDISEEGLAKAARRAAQDGLEITLLREDLETWQVHDSWDLILNFNFLLRDLIPQMVAALNPGGVILFDTILDSPEVPWSSHTCLSSSAGRVAAAVCILPRRDPPLRGTRFRRPADRTVDVSEIARDGMWPPQNNLW